MNGVEKKNLDFRRPATYGFELLASEIRNRGRRFNAQLSFSRRNATEKQALVDEARCM